MVTGVNNYYNNYQYPVPKNFSLENSYVQPNFMANQTQAVQQPVKTSADGKDDGHISLGQKLKNLGIGVGKFFTGMFTDENGNFSIGKTLKTAIVAAGIGALCVLTAGTAVPAILMATGIVVSAYGVGKAGIQAAMAETDAEAEQAWQSLGSNGVALGLSIYGARSLAKSTHAAEAAAGKFDGIKGTYNAVKTTFADAAKPVTTAFEGVKDAYQGVNTFDKITNAASKVKSNVTVQAEEFATQVGNNYNKVIYGSSAKIEDKIAKLDEKKANLEQKRDAITDTSSKAYKKLDKQINELNAERNAMSEINQSASWEDAKTIIDKQKEAVQQLKDYKAQNGSLPKEELAELNQKISIQEKAIATAEKTLSRRAAEVKAIDAKIKTLTEAQAKAETPEAIAKIEAQLTDLQAKRTAANFELPSENTVNIAKTDMERAQRVYDTQVKIKNDIKAKYPKPNDAQAKTIKYVEDALTEAKNTLNSSKTEFNVVKQAATPGGVKTQATSEILSSVKDVLTEGAYNKHGVYVPAANPTQWLTVGAAGRQFGETPEVRFYNQLTPQEQQYFKSLPYAQKLALINTYIEAA